MSTVLYSPEVLGLAASLASYGWDESLPLQGAARSRTCGSTLMLGLSTDADGRIDRLAVKAHACAIGQAAAAIFARAAPGRSPDEIAAADDAVERWLAGEGERPDWPGLEVLDAARGYPARHGAIRLAWRAARELLPTG